MKRPLLDFYIHFEYLYDVFCYIVASSSVMYICIQNGISEIIFFFDEHMAKLFYCKMGRFIALTANTAFRGVLILLFYLNRRKFTNELPSQTNSIMMNLTFQLGRLINYLTFSTGSLQDFRRGSILCFYSLGVKFRIYH